MEKHFDLIVVGAGPGGYPAAIRAAQRGKSVALIDGREAGGTCLNRGCIPSKAMIASAEQFHAISRAKNFGIHVSNPSFDYEKFVTRKDEVVGKIRKSLEGLIAANKITLIRGWATFSGPKKILVHDTPASSPSSSSQTLTCDTLILATGSEPKEIPTMRVDHRTILDSTSFLQLKTFPASMIIVGGGVIGCEFASLLSLLGCQVTILEMLPRILPAECPSVSNALTKIFEKRGIAIKTGVGVKSVSEKNGEAVALLEGGEQLVAEKALISVGRSLNTKNFGFETLGIKIDEKGIIQVNSQMETSVPHVYAVGDIASKWWLAHVATHQGVIAADNACGVESHMHYNAVPNVIFTHPEAASVGLSHEEALKQGYPAIVAQFPFQALGKSLAAMETDGFAQVVVDEKTHQILGAQVVGHDASNLIAEMALAIANELTLECVNETIHAHPTLAEAWLESSLIASGLPIHYPPKALKK